MPLFGALTRSGEDPELGRLYMPWDHEAMEEKGEAFAETLAYAGTAAHEMGHVLGLDDAYTDDEDGDRMDENPETTRPGDGGEDWASMMKRQWQVTSPNTNDIEMMLAIYGSVMDGKKSTLQSYADYTHYWKTHFLWITDCKSEPHSAAAEIHDHTDEIPDGSGKGCG